jgi:hypothetical protein
MLGLLLLALLAPPFWQTKTPDLWTDEELNTLLTDSPWAQPCAGPAKDSSGPVVLLATAKPVRQAEAERRRRAPKPAEGQDVEEGDDYEDFLRDHPASIVIAIPLDTGALDDPEEAKRVTAECTLKIGKRKIRMTGYFPPKENDPYLRIAFPREVGPEDKSLRFELYIPGTGYREVEFRTKDLFCRGVLEM